AVLDKDERESIDVVLENFRAYSAHELSAMTHPAGPWLDARRRDPRERERGNLQVRRFRVLRNWIYRYAHT
ncbi:DUF4065 domain-containing protein, partial [Streptomyces sp. A73]|nr:DUF4065 domain-containing protein [Streptomyces sp. A73]